MKTTLSTLVAALGVVLFTLWTMGCYTININTKLNEALSETIVVTTKDGKHYHFPSERWSADLEGNISGTGVLCSKGTGEYHEDIQTVEIAARTLNASQISHISSKEFNAGNTILLVVAVGLVGTFVAAALFAPDYSVRIPLEEAFDPPRHNP